MFIRHGKAGKLKSAPENVVGKTTFASVDDNAALATKLLIRTTSRNFKTGSSQISYHCAAVVTVLQATNSSSSQLHGAVKDAKVKLWSSSKRKALQMLLGDAVHHFRDGENQKKGEQTL